MLSELAALEAAYRALQPLDQAGRQRSLRWLADALEASQPVLPDDDSGAVATPAPQAVPDEASFATPEPATTGAVTGVDAVSTPDGTGDRAASTPDAPAPGNGAGEQAAAETPAPAPSRRRGTDRSARAAASERRRAGGRGRTSEQVSGSRQRRGAGVRAPARKAAANGERAYRRMPPVDDVMSAYRQAGSITALAEHFAVPRHTAQGWVQRLRRQGYQIGGRHTAG